VIVGTLGYKPREFAAQMNLNLANGWGIIRTIVDMVLKMGDGKYVIVKDPNKNVLRLYAVPSDAFDEDGSVGEKAPTIAEDEE
jgi:translation initiation factor 3 subunit D